MPYRAIYYTIHYMNAAESNFGIAQLDSSKSDRKAEKATALQQQYTTEMYNAKNVYLLSIEVSNRMKDKYFDKDLPSIHDVRD